MPVEAQTVEYVYIGDGVTVSFPFPSKFLSSSDVLVGVNGVQAVSGFTVSGAGAEAGGYVTFSTAPALGARVALLRAPPASQLLDFVNGQTILENTIDTGLDKLTMLVQYILRGLGRTFRLGDFDSGTGLTIPASPSRNTKLLGFDGTGAVSLYDPASSPAALSSIVGMTAFGRAVAGGPVLTTQIATSTIALDITRFITFGYDALNADAGAWWKEVSAPGAVKPWHKQSADGRWWQMFNRDATPQAFGAKADSTGTVGSGTDDTAAIENWLAYTLQIGFRGRLKGLYRYKPTGPWLLSGYTSGILIQGDQRNGDGFVLDAGYTLALEFGNGFYLDLDRVHVVGNVNGPVIKLGRDDFTDALNGCRFDLVVNNYSVLSGAEGVRVNYACESYFFLTSNCGGTGRPGQPTTPGNGYAIRIRQACFCFFEIAGGNANVALLLSDGYTFSNTFAAVDMEEVAVGVRCSSANATKNVFLAGQFVASTILDFTDGNQNVFHTACNMVPYSGGSLGTNLVGVEIKKDAVRTFEVTPTGPGAVPASGVYTTNTTGIKVFLKIWGGTYTAVALKAPDGGVSNWNPQVTNEQTDLILPPGWSVAITYTVAPLWRWLPA